MMEPQAHALTLGTLNVQHFIHTFEEVFSLFHTQSLTFLCIQEANIHASSAIGLQAEATSRGCSLLLGALHHGHHRTAILSKVPCEAWSPARQEAPIDLSRVQFAQLHREGGRPLLMCNVYAHQANRVARDELLRHTGRLLRHTGRTLSCLEISIVSRMRAALHTCLPMA